MSAPDADTPPPAPEPSPAPALESSPAGPGPTLIDRVRALRGWRRLALIAAAAPTEPAAAVEAATLRKAQVRLEARERQLRARLARLEPRGLYIVIDQTHNRLTLRKGDEILLDAVCSAGSGMVLKETGTARQWVFDTPRGRFQVLQRIENPVWKKPDWAFVEEGQPIPKNAAERFEYGTLGEYAFYFGNGYMIHGTLYERLLGRSVTHGCIRLGRDDLRRLWKAVPLGTSIYIY